jgi:hypothetical protein
LTDIDVILPARDVAETKGWTHQVQWVEQGNRCFYRCKSGHEADAWAEKLQRQGLHPVVVDLKDALQLH